MAQSLAETAVHKVTVGHYLTSAEKAAGGPAQPGNKTLVQIQNDMRGDTKLRESVHWEDENKILGGVMKRAPEEMIRYASQFSVGRDQIDEKVAELINSVGKSCSDRFTTMYFRNTPLSALSILVTP